MTKEDLEKLCRINGRELEISNNRKYPIMTCNKWDGCDAQFFMTIDSAYDWESGYAMCKGHLTEEELFPSLSPTNKNKVCS